MCALVGVTCLVCCFVGFVFDVCFVICPRVVFMGFLCRLNGLVQLLEKAMLGEMLWEHLLPPARMQSNYKRHITEQECRYIDSSKNYIFF